MLIITNHRKRIFWGDNLNYDVEKCDCDNFAIGTLFTTKEND